jgi:hypothetical protein
MKFIVLLLAIIFALINARTLTETETGTAALLNMCERRKTVTQCTRMSRICKWIGKTNTCASKRN